MNYELLKSVISSVEQFETETESKNGSLQDYHKWFSARQNLDIVSTNEIIGVESQFVPDEVKQMGDLPEIVIGQLLVFLSRYLKIYLKKGLEGSLMTTGDDFTYLATLFTKGSLTKTELILLSAHEKTSGMEVIKRLLNNDLIEQFDDENDKRSKRISLTEKGKGILFQSFEAMGKVGMIGAGNLTFSEKEQLMYLLKKLDNFHNDIYLNHRDLSLDEIIAAKIKG
jgi:MarR family transcriptional regulator, lower aerobic nicotinate degradation pathway regulator